MESHDLSTKTLWRNVTMQINPAIMAQWPYRAIFILKRYRYLLRMKIIKCQVSDFFNIIFHVTCQHLGASHSAAAWRPSFGRHMRLEYDVLYFNAKFLVSEPWPHFCLETLTPGQILTLTFLGQNVYCVCFDAPRCEECKVYNYFDLS